MKTLPEMRVAVEYLGGSEEETSLAALANHSGKGKGLRSSIVKLVSSPWVRGFWWAFLVLLILLFSGQTSKFIYIDF